MDKDVKAALLKQVDGIGIELGTVLAMQYQPKDDENFTLLRAKLKRLKASIDLL